jgi:hypothetical protein
MSRNALNFWLDLLLFVVMLGLIVTGVILYGVLPPGTGHTLVLFGLGRHDYGSLHGYLAFVAIALAIVHLLLHWSWVVCVVGRALGRTRLSRLSSGSWGFLFLLAIAAFLGGGIFWASTQVAPRATSQPHGAGYGRERARVSAGVHIEDHHDPLITEVSEQARSIDRSPRRDHSAAHVDKHAEECAAGKAINGRTSLRQAAALAGTTIDAARVFLALPQDVDSDERLGRLRRAYDFSIHDVRRWACRKRGTD